MGSMMSSIDYGQFEQSKPYGPQELAAMQQRYQAGLPIFDVSEMGLQEQFGRLNDICYDPRLKGIRETIKEHEATIKNAQEQISKPRIFLKEKKTMFGLAKEYAEKHKDSIMTVIVVLLVDYFFLGGALRQKIKAIAEGALDGVQKKLGNPPNANLSEKKTDAA